MNLSDIELTTEEAIHPNLATVGEATMPTDQIVPKTLHAITEGQVEQKTEPSKTVSISYCHPTFVIYLYVILQSTPFFNTIFIDMQLLQRVV